MGVTGALVIGAAVGGAGYGAYKAIPAAKKAYGLGKPTTPLSPPVMPDITTQNQAATLAEAQAASVRNGRASTILTSNSNTSDQLGP